MKNILYTFVILVGAAVGSLSFAIAQDTTIYDRFEVVPEPSGGHAAFRQWIGSNYRYPHEAVEQSVRGTLKLRFIVEKDGSLTQMEILNGLGYGTGEEAIRVLKRSPRWNQL